MFLDMRYVSKSWLPLQEAKWSIEDEYLPCNPLVRRHVPKGHGFKTRADEECFVQNSSFKET